MTQIVCPACNGKGLIDRDKTEVEEHMPWARHLFTKEICTKCGGSGVVELDPRSVTSEWAPVEQWPSIAQCEAMREVREELG